MALGDKSKTIGVVTELTLITPIKPGQTEALAAILAQIQQNPSSVIGQISTIHFARWVIFDNGTRLLFTSNFDGSWQQYLGDFVLKIPDGLDLIWGHCVDYPGANPFQPFCEWVDRFQVPTNCYYPAYPSLTVNTILRGEKTTAAVNTFLQSLP